MMHALGSQGREQEPGTRSQDKDKPQARLDVFSVLLRFRATPPAQGRSQDDSDPLGGTT